MVVPTYRRPLQLAACLRALSYQDYPSDCYEVIVVDDGSPESAENTVAPYRNRVGVRLLTQPNSGPARARNAGAAQARGEILAFTDDDCEPAPDWLRALAARSVDAPDCAIGGRTVNKLSENPYSTASQVLVDYLYGYYNADEDAAQFFTSNNLACPTELFRSMGGFAISFPHAAAEDREFCDRWLHHGHQMKYTSGAIVYHNHPLTLAGFLRQHFNYGQGALQFQRLRADRGGETRIQPLSFYLAMVVYPLSSSRSWKRLAVAILLVVSQATNAAGFFWKLRKRSLAG